MPKYSVVIPTTFKRWEQGKLRRSVSSIEGQSASDWELIVVNTNKTDIDNRAEIRRAINTDKRKVFNLERDTERVIGRNVGMRESSGEWICWLDSDDEYMSNYFEKLDQAMEEYPDEVCFNFASVVHWKGLGSSVRETFRPHKKEVGHEEFKSGHIATGSFIFRRALLDDVGYLPQSEKPYGGDDSFSAKCNNPNYPRRADGQWPPLGNPWGDDYTMFYNITRKYHSQPLDLILYIQHVR